MLDSEDLWRISDESEIRSYISEIFKDEPELLRKVISISSTNIAPKQMMAGDDNIPRKYYLKLRESIVKRSKKRIAIADIDRILKEMIKAQRTDGKASETKI